MLFRSGLTPPRHLFRGRRKTLNPDIGIRPPVGAEVLVAVAVRAARADSLRKGRSARQQAGNDEANAEGHKKGGERTLIHFVRQGFSARLGLRGRLPVQAAGCV